MKTFLLKPEHIKLLRNAYIRWEDCEYGAPAIDCKRPYGDSSVERNIAEILEWDLQDDELTSEQIHYARQLHKETETALQILVQESTLTWGTYETTSDYGNQWKRSDSFIKI